MANIRRGQAKLDVSKALGEALAETGNITKQDATVLTTLDSLINDINAPMQDKIEGIRNLQILLLGPQIKSLLNLDGADIISDKKANQARNIHWILNDIIKGLYDQQDYTQREEIDFKHPKVQKAFEFLVQGVLETLKELKLNDDTINNFIERFSNSMIGFEAELDARMYGISGTAIEQVENPLLKKYKEAKNNKEHKEQPLANSEFLDLRTIEKVEQDIEAPRHEVQQKTSFTIHKDENEPVKFVDGHNRTAELEDDEE